MAASDVDYRVYPSLLDAYGRLLGYEQLWDEPWNRVSEAAHRRGEYLDAAVGDPICGPEEMYLRCECELLDMINRVPRVASEAAARGTAFNEAVDVAAGKRGAAEGCSVSFPDDGSGDVEAVAEGRLFRFDGGLVRGAAELFRGALSQHYCSAVMETGLGRVELYGYIDEWDGGRMYDIKTTSQYEWGRYGRGWQRWVYPWCAVASGEAEEVESFTYWAVEWAYQRAGMPIGAKGIYPETYTYRHEEAGRRLRGCLESFLGWLAERRGQGLIQDRRIFGGENPEGWRGSAADPAGLGGVLFPGCGVPRVIGADAGRNDNGNKNDNKKGE